MDQSKRTEFTIKATISFVEIEVKFGAGDDGDPGDFGDCDEGGEGGEGAAMEELHDNDEPPLADEDALFLFSCSFGFLFACCRPWGALMPRECLGTQISRNEKRKKRKKEL